MAAFFCYGGSPAHCTVFELCGVFSIYALLPPAAALLSSNAALSLGTSLARMSLNPPDGGHVLLLSMHPGARTSPAALKAPTGHPSRYAAHAARTASPRRRKCARISVAVCAGGRRSRGSGKYCSPRHRTPHQLEPAAHVAREGRA